MKFTNRLSGTRRGISFISASDRSCRRCGRRAFSQEAMHTHAYWVLVFVALFQQFTEKLHYFSGPQFSAKRPRQNTSQ